MSAYGCSIARKGLALLACCLALAASPAATAARAAQAEARLTGLASRRDDALTRARGRSLAATDYEAEQEQQRREQRDYLISEEEFQSDAGGAHIADVNDEDEGRGDTAPVLDDEDRAALQGMGAGDDTAAAVQERRADIAVASPRPSPQHSSSSPASPSSGLPSFEGTPVPPTPSLEQWQRQPGRGNVPEELGSGTFLLPGHPPRGYAAACLVVRDAHDDIGEWVRHHLRLGFWPIYVYDDGSTPPLSQVLRRRIDAGDVSYAHFPNFTHPSGRPQLYAYDRCLEEHGGAHSWLAFFDVDEFLVFRDGPAVQSVPSLLQRYEEHSALAVHWLLFGSSGHQVRPPKGALASYVRCLPQRHTQHLFVKTIVNTR